MNKAFTVLSMIIAIGLQSQTISVLQPACNHDGVLLLDATTAGFTTSVSYTWYENGIVVKNTPLTLNYTDTLFNYAGGPLFAFIQYNGQTTSTGGYYFPPFTYTLSTTTNMCPTLSTASVNISGGLAPYSVKWVDPSGATVATGTTCALPSGGYTVEITDANNCTFGSKEQSDSLYIGQSSPISLTYTNTVANCTNGTASVTSVSGGLAPYTYFWSTGSAGSQIINLSTGNYSVVVSDAQGCQSTAWIWVPQGVTISANPVTTSATCLQNNGTVISFGSGGVPPYNYIYSSGQTTQTASGLVAGNYNVQATDANGCYGTDYFTINASTPISVNYNYNTSLCTAPTGSATLTITGGTAPYTVSWGTIPAQSGPVISNVYGGLYYFTVTDANGCVQTGSVNIPSASNMGAYAWATASSCPGNSGSANVTAWSNFPPLTYSWSTGSTNSSIGGLPPGGYTCVITDAMGCQLTKTTNVLFMNPIQVGFSNTPSTCVFRNDGSITASISGGTPPYTYLWSNGQNTTALSNLVGDTLYYFEAKDANGCSSGVLWDYLSTNFQNDSCYCTVKGNVYHDVNANCLKDPGEVNVNHMLIKDNNTNHQYSVHSYAFTDTSGNYSFILPTGNYNIQEVIQYMYPPSSCQNNNNPLSLTAYSGCTYTVDFANGINPLHDLHVMRAHLTLPVPGNNYLQQVIIQNDGTVQEDSVEFRYGHDGQMPFVSSSGISLSQPNSGLAPDWYSASNLSLQPGVNASSLITYAVPTNIPLGTHVNFWDTAVYKLPVSNWLTDYSPWNNVNAFDTVVVGSFDPNMKEVYPQGVGPLGYISPTDTVLDYVVHFQNTGTWNATKVVVVDSLDADLDWETLKPGYSNHSYSVSMDNMGVVTFIFDNIQLPPQMYSEIGSIGVFAYSIHAKRNLPIGTQFRNRAAIFFDYNEPIYTNTTVNTISNSIGVKSVKSNDGNMILFPNPASESCTIKLTGLLDGKEQLQVYDMQGSMMLSEIVQVTRGENRFDLSVTQLQVGLYIIRLGSSSCKLSVIR